MNEESQVSPVDIMDGFDPGDRLDGGPRSIEDFPPEAREAVEGLLWLGYLEDQFDIYGHTFVIRTLRGDEELLASLVSKEYVETLGQTRAFIWARIALALVSVDGDEEFCEPIGPDRRAYARSRFQYCTANWYWPVAEKIFERYVALEERQVEALGRVEDLSQGNLPMSMPSVGSSTDKGDLQEPPEIMEYLDPPDSADSNNDWLPSTTDES